VQLHREFAADGLVVMSLDIMPDEWDEQEKVLKFLTDKQADFPNYIFKDRQQKVDDWLEKHGVSFTPAVIAFDRTGKRVPVPPLKSEKDEELFVKKLLGK
jgi:hypothetical protein